MLAAPMRPSPTLALPLALTPVYTLFSRQARLRRQALLSLPVNAHDERQRWLSNADASSLLLEQILESWLDPPSPTAAVSLTERLVIILNAITSIVETTAPDELCVPVIQNQLQRQCMVPATAALVIEQCALCVLLAAVDDGAFRIVVSLDRTEMDLIVLEIEADAAGLARRDLVAQYCTLEQALQGQGMNFATERRPQSWLTRIAVPVQPMSTPLSQQGADAE